MQEVPRAALLDGSFHAYLLRDEGRTRAYAEAIARVVKPGDVVADVGSGTGILAYLAARAGARKVYAVELNTHSYKTILRLARVNGVLGQVMPVLADGERWTPPEPVDVLVCELMETGLIHEPIVGVARHANAKWPAPPRRVLPAAARLLAEGVTQDDVILGYRAPLPGFRAVGNGEAVTDAVEYARVDFSRADLPEGIDAAFDLTAGADGTLHALRLRTLTDLAPDLSFETGPAYCSPIVLPLDEPFAVAKGDRLTVRLRYEFSYGSEPIRLAVERAG